MPHSACERAELHGARKLGTFRTTAYASFIASEVRELLARSELERIRSMPSREKCRLRFLYYRGDDNYGLGNVLYDVASAGAMAIILNRTLIYGANSADRKFGSLLEWPSIPTLHDVETLYRRVKCGGGPLASRRRVVLAPDRCTFQKTWRKERRGEGKCFKKLLSTNWVAERASIIELSKSHAYTGIQTLLKSVHRPIRERAAALAGGCISHGARPNTFGHLLAAMVRPSAPVLDALRWTLERGGEASASASHSSRLRPHISLHVRAMSDYRARNLTSAERDAQLTYSLSCLLQAARSIKPMKRRALVALIVSSSPDVRDILVDRLARSPAQDGLRIEPLVFNWREYLAQASPPTVQRLAQSELEAAAFCMSSVAPSERHRCNSSAHLQDWGPAPHWVAVVELLLVASTTNLVIGGGFPYFKVCNTFSQIGAALAEASPWWLCGDDNRGRSNDWPPQRCNKASQGRVRLVCASRLFATDWGSSAWRMFEANTRRGSALVLDCAHPQCMSTPLQPELWDDLAGIDTCPLTRDHIQLFAHTASGGGQSVRF